MVEEVIETFLLILLTLIYKKSVLHQEPPVTCNIELLTTKKVISKGHTLSVALTYNYILMHLLK